jgi:hypothetical protein
MAADEDDCVSYACECVRLAGLGSSERRSLRRSARRPYPWTALGALPLR